MLEPLLVPYLCVVVFLTSAGTMSQDFCFRIKKPGATNKPTAKERDGSHF